MGKKLTTADFIERARAVHGDRYDYSKTTYVNQKTRVVIVCAVHGAFLQLPQEHYAAGSGCRVCANKKRGEDQRFDTANFVQRARRVHGDKYDYSKTKYVSQKQKVTITCPQHGDFEQWPAGHYHSGSGCPKCGLIQKGLSRRVSQEQFIQNASKHFPEYDFSISEYSTAKRLVRFVCPNHGQVEQYGHHLNAGKVGCPMCGNERAGDALRLTHESFLQSCWVAHGTFYDYSESFYAGAKTPVVIRCPIHGKFEQLPAVHTKQGGGCPSCGDIRGATARRKTNEQFIVDAIRMHGDRYSYSVTDYKGAHKPISVECREHGVFTTTPDGHVNGMTGCPVCAPGGFNPCLRGILYYLRVAHRSETLFKIGVTNKNDPLHRWGLPEDKAKIRVLGSWTFFPGKNALDLEKEILLRFKRHQYSGPNVLKASGNTELFKKDVLGLDPESGELRHPIVSEIFKEAEEISMNLDD